MKFLSRPSQGLARLFLFLLLCLLSFESVLLGIAAASDEQLYSVVSYLPEWRYEGANWETIAEHSSHILLFSLEPGANGEILAQDRIPRKELLDEARAAAKKHGAYLMLCFGGNGRSAGFSGMVRDQKSRSMFVKRLMQLLRHLDLDGVDYNWEYPGYQFGRGYLSEEEIKEDYKGLSRLIKLTKTQFEKEGRPRAVTMAYYPDTRQEQLIKQYKIDQYADLMHMMSYDQGGGHHSSLEFGKKAVDQGVQVLDASKLTMGLPFYGRHSRTGDWTTYEDLVQRHHPLAPATDVVPAPEAKGGKGGSFTIGFNGVATIEEKTGYALTKQLGGVMIWEVGQDCRLVPVTHGKDTHVRTCPSDESSLLLAITRAATAAGYTRVRLKKEAEAAKKSDEL
mmetsp:Transcript_55663/g.121621  ORF Transcript_55663/g.121621 Transcript_55663/m.121621 type:complete len:394 (-) Transcript_55663:377-1558(-)